MTLMRFQAMVVLIPVRLKNIGLELAGRHLQETFEHVFQYLILVKYHSISCT